MRKEYKYNPFMQKLMIYIGSLLLAVSLLFFIVTGHLVSMSSALIVLVAGFLFNYNVLVFEDKHCEVTLARLRGPKFIKYDDITEVKSDNKYIRIFTGETSLKIPLNILGKDQRNEVKTYFSRLVSK